MKNEETTLEERKTNDNNIIESDQPSTSSEPAEGIITPEQPSDITSSDAVTINSTSSASNSEGASVAEVGTPPGEEQHQQQESSITSLTQTVQQPAADTTPPR